VNDVGAGYANEYRLARVLWGDDITPFSDLGLYVGSIDPTLEPPEGYTPLPVQPPVDYWQDPAGLIMAP